MKTILLIISLSIAFISCTKTDNHLPDIIPSDKNSELSRSIFEVEYGNCYDFEDIGRNPLTLLSSNDIIISAINYDGLTDKLQITKINSAGNLIWQKNITQGYKFMSGQCFETSSGELIVLGASISQSSWVQSQTYIAKLNTNTGDTIWTRTYGHNYIDRGIVGYEDASNNYWVVNFRQQDANATLLKIGSNGDSLTSVFAPAEQTYEDALITSNKEIILVGESGNFVTTHQPVFITKYTNGVLSFTNDIELTNYDALTVSNVCETSDGNYVISGECYNFANTSIRYGFLLKVDNNGNKIWENILTQFNNSSISSCVEKQNDVFYLGVGSYSSGNLYKYDLSTLKMIDEVFQMPDAQLLIKNGTLYRGIIDFKPSFYETVKVKAYTIN